MSPAEVCVTGLGLYTPAGDGAAATWGQVCKGLPTAELVGSEGGSPRLACRAPAFDPARLGRARARKPDRATAFALLAAQEALADAGLDPAEWDGARVGVVLGSGLAGVATYEGEHRSLLAGGTRSLSALAFPSTLGNSLSAQLAIELGVTGPSFTVNTACAAGATAIGLALDLLRLDRCDLVVTGGADAALTPYYYAGFDRVGALSRRYHDPAGALRPFDAERDGFVIGEGAGVLVLERTADARARGARPRARLLGYGLSSDAHHVVKPDPLGVGLRACLEGALADAGVAPGEVAHVNAHGTGTPLGDRAEAEVLARLLPHRPVVSATKAVTGHLLGAAGAVEAALTVLAIEAALAPPTANLTTPDTGLDLLTTAQPLAIPVALSTSAGFGGQNAALVLASA
ncbi:3-oxoacyl-ACP synthase [Kitasatospora sp. MMS16-BH015]|uniref:beta-ketoacyl-[acyl-carrier-protein] synthase family protein n=1 Tax=Kitasatospora sp. MMS16-BH015 TaxID=2018025 RepID=UPI000CA12FC7|nr:beta-ketoacyl-[acyl-carrier-protein] synthase family protein [Kitasatospora sp. MMS16-BH015]AUG80718.1 3-oxoacyl-ACP synthase [Kitasatospora sp. MMS16-BH015]